jgi:hypothetical protein
MLCKKEMCVLAGTDFNARGISDTLVGMVEATHPAGRKLFRRRTRQRILAAGDRFAVDLPERCVLLDQFEAAVAEGPDVHQPLDEGEKQCR